MNLLKNLLPWLAQHKSSLFTAFIALITIYIAYQQYKTAKYKLKLDLYEKRYCVYNKLIDFLKEIKFAATSGPRHEIDYNTLFEFSLIVSESQFLFSDELCNYLNEVWEAAKRINTINIKLEEDTDTFIDDKVLVINGPPKTINRTDLSNQKYLLLVWAGNQFQFAANHFESYLSFRKIK